MKTLALFLIINFSFFIPSFAYLTPEEAGDAVYTARIMLGIDPVMEGSVAFRLAPNKSIDKDSKVKVYPNPALNKITIEFLNQQTSKSGSIEILDLSGRTILKSIYSSKKSKFDIDVHSIEKGIYIYKISTTEGSVFSGKINKI